MASKEEKFAAQTEKSLRKNLNVPTPLPYQIFPPQSGGLPAQSFLTGMIGGRPTIEVTRGWHKEQDVMPLCYVYFNVAQPRPFELQVLIGNPGFATFAYLHRLAYAVPLMKRVVGPVGIADSRRAVFAGEPMTATRLNSNPQLLKLANTLAVTERREEGRTFRISRCLQISPVPTGSVLILHTLPKMGMMRENLLASEVLQLASAIEAML